MWMPNYVLQCRCAPVAAKGKLAGPSSLGGNSGQTGSNPTVGPGGTFSITLNTTVTPPATCFTIVDVTIW